MPVPWGAKHTTTSWVWVWCRAMHVVEAIKADQHPHLLPPISHSDSHIFLSAGGSKDGPIGAKTGPCTHPFDGRVILGGVLSEPSRISPREDDWQPQCTLRIPTHQSFNEGGGRSESQPGCLWCVLVVGCLAGYLAAHSAIGAYGEVKQPGGSTTRTIYRAKRTAQELSSTAQAHRLMRMSPHSSAL